MGNGYPVSRHFDLHLVWREASNATHCTHLTKNGDVNATSACIVYQKNASVLFKSAITLCVKGT